MEIIAVVASASPMLQRHSNIYLRSGKVSEPSIGYTNLVSGMTVSCIWLSGVETNGCILEPAIVKGVSLRSIK